MYLGILRAILLLVLVICESWNDCLLVLAIYIMQARSSTFWNLIGTFP